MCAAQNTHSELGGKASNVLLGKDRKTEHGREQQSLTAITTDAEPDLLMAALSPVQFALSPALI